MGDLAGRCETSAPTLTEGQNRQLSLDTGGNARVTQGTTTAGEDVAVDVQKVETRTTLKYQAAAAADVVVKAAPGFLFGVTVGKDVAGGIIEVSDHASDGDGNVVYYLEDPNPGYYPVNAAFAVGITSDITTQTNVTFHWR